jgi:hypothetical protein
VARDPRDPRIQFHYALSLLRKNDRPGAEKALRTALAEEPLWRHALAGGDLSERTHALLALVVDERPPRRGNRDRPARLRPLLGRPHP